MKNNILLIMLFVFMLILNIFVGPSIRNSLYIVNILSLLITSFYILFCFIKKKKFRVIDNKIDIFVFLFLLLPIITVIFNSQVSMSSTMEVLLQNISIFSFYLFIKNISIKSKYNNIINIIILSTIPIIVIGIDRLTFGYIWEYLSKFNIFNIEYNSNRLLSNFNYPNTLAIYLSSILFLIFGQLNNNKKSFIYSGYIFVLLLFVFLTKSRITIVLLVFFIIIFLINNRDKCKTIISILFVNMIHIYIYFMVFKLFSFNNLMHLIILLLLFISNFIVYLLLFKFNKFIKKINVKKLIKFYIIFIVVGLVYFIVGLNISSPLKVKDYEVYKYKVDSTTSKIKIDLNSSGVNDDSTFKIKIEGIDFYSNKTEIIYDKFNEYNGIKEYDLSLVEDYKFIMISFYNDKNCDLTINNLYINNEEYKINYKLLPNSLINKIKSFSVYEKSVIERMLHYKDALNIFKDNWFVGCGYECWQHSYKSYQSYNYTINIMHSFIIDTLINYGVVGFIVLILLVCLIVYYIIKHVKLSDIGVVFAILILFIHSFVDFDMSYLLIRYYIFILISLFVSNYRDKFVFNNIIVSIMVLLLFFVSLYYNIFSVYIEKNIDKINIIEYDKRYVHYKKLYRFYPYSLRLNYYKLLYEYNNLINSKYKLEDIEESFIKDLNYFINNEKYYDQNDIQELYIDYIRYKLSKNIVAEELINEFHDVINNIKVEKFDINQNLERVNLLLKLYEIYVDYNNKTNNEFINDKMLEIKEIILYEYNFTLENFKNYKKTNYTERERNDFIINYKNLIKDII